MKKTDIKTQKQKKSPYFALPTTFCYSRGFTPHSTSRRFSLFRNNGKLSAGFTFIETVVAIAVLIVSVVAPLSLAAQGLRIARIARDQVIANYLAQEAVEFLRFTRDSDAINGNEWLESFPDDCFNGGSCVVDITDGADGTITACTGNRSGICPVIRFDETTGTYGYNEDWSATRFTRTVRLTYGSDQDREISAQISVSWNDIVLERTYELHEKLFNWQ